MITEDGYFSWADRDIKLPHDHRWYGDTPVDIVVCHSLEGTTDYWFFLDPDAPPHKGWHATVTYEGVLRQHCPIWWGLAHGGDANPHGPGIESEGFSGEPLTDAQVKTWRRILKDLADWKGRPYTRSNGKLTEHREWSDTSCPSGRYEPLYVALREPLEEEEDDMTPEQAREIAREVAVEELEAWRKEFIENVGADPMRHAEAVSKRLWAIHEATNPEQVPGDDE